MSATGAAITGTFDDVVRTLAATRDRVAEERARLTSQLEAIGHALAALGSRSEPKAKVATPAKRGSGRRAKRGTVTLSILRVLNEKGPIKPAALAAAANLNPNTVSTLLDSFRRKRLAVRNDAGWSLSVSGKAELARRKAAGA